MSRAHDVASVQVKIAELQRDLKTKSQELSELDWMHDLLSGEGTILEAAVLRAFKEVGVAAVFGPPNRADILLRMGDHVFAAEVKGYSGAAKETAINQCNRWVAETTTMLEDREAEADDVMKQYSLCLEALGCYSDDGSPLPMLKVKGLIICNTFRDIEPDQRPDMNTQLAQHFPMVFQTKLDHHKFAAISTLQILGLLNRRRSGSLGDADEVIKLLPTRNGVVSQLLDWKSFLSKVDETGN